MKQRLTIPDIAVHELPAFRRDLGELRAEPGWGFDTRGGCGRLTHPLHHRQRFEFVTARQRNVHDQALAHRWDLVGFDEDPACVDHVIAAKALVEIGRAVGAEICLDAAGIRRRLNGNRRPGSRL